MRGKRDSSINNQPVAYFFIQIDCEAPRTAVRVAPASFALGALRAGRSMEIALSTQS